MVEIMIETFIATDGKHLKEVNEARRATKSEGGSKDRCDLRAEALRDLAKRVFVDRRVALLKT